MSDYEVMVDTFSKLNKAVMNSLAECSERFKREETYLVGIEKDIENYKKTGALTPTFQNVSQDTQLDTEPLRATRGRPRKRSTSAPSHADSSKENSRRTISNSSKSNERSHQILLEDTVNILPNTTQEHEASVLIKVEKETNKVLSNVKGNVTELNIKQELMDMPPPAKPPVKNTRKRNQKLSVANVKIEVKRETSSLKSRAESNLRDSDILIQNDTIDIVILDDSMEAPQPARSTRARTKARQMENTNQNESEITKPEPEKTRTKRRKANRSETKEDSSPENLPKHVTDIQNNAKQKFSMPVAKNKKTPKRVHCGSSTDDDKAMDEEDSRTNRSSKFAKKDSVSNPNSAERTPFSTPQGEIINATLVVTEPALLKENVENQANLTVVISSATNSKQAVTMDDIMTEDEDIVDGSPLSQTRHTKPKPMFNPYENSPVKTRVQAFEKLGATVSKPSKPTRAKTKLTSVETPTRMENVPRINKASSSSTSKNEKEFSRQIGTPTMENRIRNLLTASASKTQLPIRINNASSTTGKIGSGLKLSQQEFRDRELRRRCKEAEALQKKEALLHANAEAKRRKREERELKVQQQKLAKEKQKQKQLEDVERAKEEKLKQVLAEKEAKLLKQKGETAQKRAAAAKKAEEQKRSDKNIPMYFKYQTPLLPTADCYDSDDSTNRGTFTTPQWQQKSALKLAIACMSYCGPIGKGLFLSGPHTPDLRSIFPTIQPAKLKRTSSAIWNKTERSILDSLMENDED